MIMLIGATALSLSVSTTHTIIGCIMGFAIAAKGFDSIDWDLVRRIMISWAVAPPLCTGAVAFIFFGTLRHFVMRSENAFQRANRTFPLVLFMVSLSTSSTFSTREPPTSSTLKESLT